MKVTTAFVSGILALTTLTGAANIDSVSPREPYPGETGPTCYGGNYSYHVWNLFAPQDVYGVDSCVATQLIAARNLAGNYALYVSLVTARVPVLLPEVVFAMAWQTGNQFLTVCASKGTGIEFVLDGRTGMVLGCREQ